MMMLMIVHATKMVAMVAMVANDFRFNTSHFFFLQEM